MLQPQFRAHIRMIAFCFVSVIVPFYTQNGEAEGLTMEYLIAFLLLVIVILLWDIKQACWGIRMHILEARQGKKVGFYND